MMTQDPTERVAGKILRGLQDVKDYVDGKKPATVTIPGSPSERMTMKDQVLLEDIQHRHRWRVKTWAEVASHMSVGSQIWPDHVWEFYHLDPIEGDPDRKRWVITARLPYPA